LEDCPSGTFEPVVVPRRGYLPTLIPYFSAGPVLNSQSESSNLYDRVADTIRVDFKEELDFLIGYDSAISAIRQIIDMPNRRASLLANLCLQNGGRLSAKKRPQFSEVSDDEIRRIEEAISASVHPPSEGVGSH